MTKHNRPLKSGTVIIPLADMLPSGHKKKTPRETMAPEDLISDAGNASIPKWKVSTRCGKTVGQQTIIRIHFPTNTLSWQP